MRAFLVDDERLAWIHLKKMLENEAPDIEVIGMYSDATEAISAAKELAPDIIFMDIHMPGMNGLRLGEQLQQIVPGVEIVFVTAYDQYALQAFELYALDYLMKPIRPERLRKTIERLRAKLAGRTSRTATLRLPEEAVVPAPAAASAGAPQICCLGPLRFRLPGAEPQLFKWRTSKAQELFAFLLHHRERTLSRDEIIELLWSDFDLARAAQQLYTTVYHIRQTLKNCSLGSIGIASGDLGTGYRITIGDVRLDSDEWETRIKSLEALDAGNAAKYEEALDLFTGAYFEGLEYMWAEHERERQLRLWLFHARRIAGFYEDRLQLQDAIRINSRIQKLFPYEDDSYFALMKLYNWTNNYAGVEEQYWLLSTKVAQELESAVNGTITAWYELWKAGQTE